MGNRKMSVVRAAVVTVGLAVPLGLALCGAGPAAAQDAASGQDIARRWCANCHVTGLPGQATANDTAPSFPAIAARPGVSQHSLEASIAGPHPRMPDFNLSQSNVANVAAYILSLRKAP
jgi:mono/diheme cytochrome c family protein